MLIHIYTSDERLKEIAFYLDSSNLNEVKTTSEKSVALKGEIKGGLPNWLGIFGFSGEGSIGADGEMVFSKEEVPKEINFIILKLVRDFFLKKDFVYINSSTEVKNERFSSNFVRVKGCFKPILAGSNPLEKITSFEESTYVEWEGNFNGTKIKFGTTKNNYKNKTLIFQYINNESEKNYFDLFALLLKKTDDEIELLPLFFGVEIEF